jgi:hypothetical protein
MAKLLKLPIGIQTFENIRTEGYLYVDKTKHLVDLIDGGKVYFLSRPRRFGKSLTISTFDALLSGKKELFQGLAAEEFLNRPEYTQHPVVRLDMSDVTTNMGIDVLRSSILSRIQRSAERLGITIEGASPGDTLSILLERAARQGKTKVALLIDEYDKPFLDHVHDPAMADEVRHVLRDVYSRIKAADEYLTFVFMTGISKFSKMGVFSSLNSLTDISDKDEYATMLGYTEDELLSNFDGYLEKATIKLEEDKQAVVAQIRDYYDGFSFDGKNRLYNPFSTLNFFADMTFKNYWFETGTPSFLAEYVKRHDLEMETFRGIEVMEGFTTVAEIESATPESFLYQSGYLSVREKQGRKLILDYPNMEVLSAVSTLFLRDKYRVAHIGPAVIDVENALACGNAESVVKIYNALLTTLPYDLYEREAQKYAKGQNVLYAPAYAESFYHALLFSMIWASRTHTTSENHSYKGRSDIEAEKNGWRYVIEMKVADGKEAAEAAAIEGMKQIRDKGYADKYAVLDTLKGIILMAIAVDKESRSIGAAKIERL